MSPKEADKRRLIVFLFAGQGAQYHGMAKALYDYDPTFRDQMDCLDRQAARKLGASVLEQLYHGGGSRAVPFDRLLFTHPALFMVQYSLARALMARGIQPDILVGVSLGEYVALALAKVLPAASVLDLLLDHARAAEQLCGPGAMMGVTAKASLYRADPVLQTHTSLVGAGSPSHFVVSGDKAGVETAGAHLAAQGIEVQHLPVRFGFHSPQIEPVRSAWALSLSAALGKQAPGLPEIPIISCLTGLCPDQVGRSHLLEIGFGPVRFPKALETLAGLIDPRPGGRARTRACLVDLGPGAILSAYVRQNRILVPAPRVFRMMTRFGDECKNLEKLVQGLRP